MSARPRPVAELTNVTRVYPGHPPVWALRGVNLRIDQGELVGIVGPSGSGKTTLPNILGTLDRADAGTVRIDGHDVASLLPRQVHLRDGQIISNQWVRR